MILETKMVRDTSFTPAPALSIPEIGKPWISKRHDSKRDHLGANYIRKYYKAYAIKECLLMKEFGIVYQRRGERLDNRYLQNIWKN